MMEKWSDGSLFSLFPFPFHLFPCGHGGQDDLMNSAHPALEQADLFVLFPIGADFGNEVELLCQIEQEAVVPLFGRIGLADTREIEHHDHKAFLAEASGSAHH